MNKFKLLGLVRHFIGVAGAVAGTLGFVDPGTVETIDAATGQVVETAAAADPSLSEALGAFAVVVAFLWSYFAPEKRA